MSFTIAFSSFIAGFILCYFICYNWDLIDKIKMVQSAKGMKDKKSAMMSMGMNLGMNPMSESKIFSNDNPKKDEKNQKSK